MKHWEVRRPVRTGVLRKRVTGDEVLLLVDDNGIFSSPHDVELSWEGVAGVDADGTTFVVHEKDRRRPHRIDLKSAGVHANLVREKANAITRRFFVNAKH